MILIVKGMPQCDWKHNKRTPNYCDALARITPHEGQLSGPAHLTEYKHEKLLNLETNT